MKELKTTQERRKSILNQLEEWKSRCVDRVIEAGQLSRNTDQPGFCINANQENPKAEPVEVSIHAESQLLGRLRIPASYIHRCPDNLQAENINFWLDTHANKKLLVRFLDKKIRAIFSTRHSGDNMDDHKVIPIVLDQLVQLAKDQDESDLHIKNFFKQEDFTVLRVFYKHLKAEKDEQTYYAGVTVTNSETGKSSVWIRPTIRGGNYTGMFDFIDKLNEGATSIKHVGELKEDRIRKGIELAKEVAQIGISRLMETNEEMIPQPGKHVGEFIKKADFLPNRLIDILEEEYKEVQEASRLAIAKSILTEVKSLPIYEKHLAEGEVGRYLDLFRNSKKRLKQILSVEQ